MPIVELDDAEWQQVMNALIAQNPLLMKVAGQLRAQQQPADNPSPIVVNKQNRQAADGKEASHE
jgi:hypothetical protein